MDWARAHPARPLSLLLPQGSDQRGNAVRHLLADLICPSARSVLPLVVFLGRWAQGNRAAHPRGILFTVGLVCQLSTLFDSWQYLWPGFILAPAVGLFEFYWFGNRNKYLLIPINILTVLSLLFFAVFSLGALYNRLIFGQPLLAIALIAIGAGLMIAPKRRS